MLQIDGMKENALESGFTARWMNKPRIDASPQPGAAELA
jgi:hypothetical protein